MLELQGRGGNTWNHELSVHKSFLHLKGIALLTPKPIILGFVVQRDRSKLVGHKEPPSQTFQPDILA